MILKTVRRRANMIVIKLRLPPMPLAA